MTTTSFPPAAALEPTQARALIAAVCVRSREVDQTDYINGICALGTLLGLNIYHGSGDDIEGDHIVLIHRRHQVYGHITFDGERTQYWHN